MTPATEIQGQDEYARFLSLKAQGGARHGFEPVYMPSFLFDFQSYLVDWALMQGRAAMLTDCGTGKTPCQLVWAENVVRKTNGRVLILTPLAVAYQTVREGEKFGVECFHSRDGKFQTSAKIVVTNYEKLHLFNPADFVAVVCDESAILKDFDGVRRAEITVFMRKVLYRLLCSATAAPNDYPELGTSSEALGYLGYMDMLTRYFKNEQNSIKPVVYRHRGQNHAELNERVRWRFKGHAEESFWRWVCSWARAMRRPSDLGFDDGQFILPPLIEREHMVEAKAPPTDRLFDLPAVGLREQREERRRTIQGRCERVASLVSDTGKPALVWCHLNPEGDLLEKLIPGAVQVSGRDSDEAKEEKLMAFAAGEARVLVTKPTIGAWGLNFQHCAHVTFFPSHSWEQYYQGVRRCWRFGQSRPVTVDVVTTEGERDVLKNLQRKAVQAEHMFERLIEHMNAALHVENGRQFTEKEAIPSWL